MTNLKFRVYIPEAEYKEEDMFYQEDQYLSSFIKRIYDAYVVTHPTYLSFELEERLMQFIGIQDKNVKDIYEGDILGSGGERLYIVKYYDDEARFVAMQLKNNPAEYGSHISTTWIEVFGIEVVGNIYQNPDLI